MSNILIAISGSIAAYKIPLLIRQLTKNGDRVRCVLTASAHAFITPTTLQALSGEIVRSELFNDAHEAAMGHIELAKWADALLIAPATANLIAKLAHGIADDLISTLYLATPAPVLIAPAMNQQMWQHPATQANLQTLEQRPNHHILPVGYGQQACKDIGAGRLLEIEEIYTHLQHTLHPSNNYLNNLTIAITAGPTREAIDPVRYISNHSSGKMGYALAQAAQQHGANVLLITGPTALPPPANVHTIHVTSALEMYQAVEQTQCDIFIGTAAVSDYRPAQPSKQKQKKTLHGMPEITLIENPDIIASVANRTHNRPFVVGFAAETEHLIPYAQAKLKQKNLDIIIANNVSDNIFNADDNQVTLITANEQHSLARQNKQQLAHQLLHYIFNQYKGQQHDPHTTT